MVDASEIISGQNFASRCDYVFCQMHDTGNGAIPVGAKVPPSLKGGEVVFCKTDYITTFEEVVEHYVPRDIPFHLITHDSDFPIDDQLLSLVPKLKSRPVIWWSMNCCTLHANPIPIGIANSYCKITMKGKDFQQSVSPTRLLYVNHRVETFPHVRLPAFKMFQDKPWATVMDALPKGMIDSYKNNLLDHKFVLCPRGNGVDTHRLWEALYCGVIPVVIRHRAHDGLEGNLPILFVDSYEQVTEDFLNSKYQEFKTKEWKQEMLTVSWWMNRIRENNHAN